MNHPPGTPQDRSGPDGPRQWKSKELRELEARAFPEGFTLRDEANAIVATSRTAKKLLRIDEDFYVDVPPDPSDAEL